MKGLRTAVTAAVALSATAVAQTECQNILTTQYNAPAVHPGWQAQLIMNGLVKPRTIAVDNAGALIVLDAGVGVRHITFTDHGHTCLEVDQNKVIIELEGLNHGMAFSIDGRTLYASTVDSVFAWPYDPSTGAVSGNGTEVITGMASNQHVTRTLVVSRHSPGYLVVSRGSGDNLATEAMNIDSGMSQIRAFNINNTDSFPIDYLEGRVLGWGLRNSVGVAEEPTSGRFYSVENSVDDVERNGQLIKEDNPAEELNEHGTIEDAPENEANATNYGYPQCYAVWDADDIPDHDNLEVGDQFAIDTNTTLDDTTCREEYQAPRLAFPAHTAPLDIIFNENGTEAWISFHGSFNRENPQGYSLSVVGFANGEPTEPHTSANSLTHIVRMTDLSTCPENCFRPVGLAWESQGRLYVTSDSTGEIFILERQSGTPSSTESGTLVQPTETGSANSSNGGSGNNDDSAATGLAAGSLGVAAVAIMTAFLLM
ncbi:hypothetical protein VDGE_02107 [Verticillium dahliae]|uniref:Pyrroloquinoline quinone-dependent pyranose dehydrogenase beta-propeller domain-containing protein n=1 Tax=Verticillium dahliae TaxID=27337 RepID=A0A444RXT4_VERDA|nr:hypothetical protein VDGE_02107 [Verticillium dahliae]